MRGFVWPKHVRGGILLGCLCLGLSVSPATPAAPPALSEATDQPVRFDILDGSANGVLLPGKKLALSVQVTGKPAAQREEVVATFEADSFPTRLVPMTRNPEPRILTASVLFEPYSESLLAAKQKAIRIDVVIARRRSMVLEPFVRRRLYVTIGQPAAVTQKPAVPEQSPATKQETGLPQESIQPDPETVSEEAIKEEELLPAPPMIQSRAYWRTVNNLISRSWRQAVGRQGKASVRRSPRVQFRLYANGEAQLVQVERSSGDRAIDDAGLQAVINAHPFPPLPSPFQEPHIDVHVDLPSPPR